jgi:glycerophosphoryl diester phosphodiesterase
MIVAHRGASSAMAEHTLAAYIAAIESGVDALECDVRLTRDGHLVCVHDRTVNRTSDGIGVVSELDLARLEALDFASWHDGVDSWPDSPDQLLRDEPYLAGVVPDRTHPAGGVLRLEALLGLVHDSSRPVRLLIETKHPTRYGGLVEKELVRLLARFGWAGTPGPDRRRSVDETARVTVMSFAPTALRRVRLLAPDLPSVLLMERLLPGRREALLPTGVGIAGPGIHLLRADPDFVARAHAKGKGVYVWTVDEVADLELVLELGVDAVITNRPAETIAAIDGPARR